MSHAPRLHDFDYIGRHRYFLTFCTHDREAMFVERRMVDLVCDQLLISSKEHDIAVDVYCVMEDHVHLLVRGINEESDLRAFMHHLKQHSGWSFKRDRRRRLWQKGYYDHVLRDEEGTASVLAYIVNNPVRHGLTDTADQYPYWGSFTQTREEILHLITEAEGWAPTDPGGPTWQPVKGE